MHIHIDLRKNIVYERGIESQNKWTTMYLI